ncbi:flagellar filament capping protein FliD [Paenibacillus sp.]|jgi:flagellar hook-associated protein 2|uniref:flagellar filament capping protein FliD n=1 Tax=Paenibacillus sp. TaxID=58172 RepID=UPI00281C588C|nr:flagellar filament capping protein FliD [Paenibacillus sp.]MDR0268710.1 flagellar filament capping protein FliD [Paenibacillus sp.]
MAINGPTRLTGFSGTLDTDSLIAKLMKAERVPYNKVLKSKQFTIWQRQDYQTMNTALLSFRNAANNLRFDSNFEKTIASSSNTSVVEISSSGTSAGISTVKVDKLATSATIISGSISTPTQTIDKSGTISINGKATVSFTEASTAESIIKDINSKSSLTGVKANFDKASGVLYLSSSQLGDSAEINITNVSSADPNFDKDSLDNFTSFLKLPSKPTANGSDAEYYVNGSTTVIKSASNSVSINGVQVTLRSPGEASIGVVTDRSGIVDKVKEFVTQYNSLIDIYSTAANTRRSRDYAPLTAEEKEGMSESQITQWEKRAREGTLYNDSVLKDTLSSLRSALNTPLDVPKGQIQMLSNIGITVMNDYRDNGKLQIDEAKLQEAINTRFDEVKQLFTMSSDNAPSPGKSNLGIADRLYNVANAQMGKFKQKMGVGSVEALDDSVLGKQLKVLSQQESDWKKKLEDIETRYYKKFAAMEAALEKMNKQGSWLASQAGSM